MPLSDKRSNANQIKITDINSVQVAGAATRAGGQNIVTVEVTKTHSIDSFKPNFLEDKKGIKYSETIDQGEAAKIQKNSRFRINDLTRGPLSVEAEEEQRIEAEIQRRLDARLDEIRAQSTKEAYAAGFDSGKKDARVEVLTEAKPMLGQFQALLGELDRMKAEVFKANEDFIMHLVFRLARSVVLRELKDDADYTRRLAHQLIERVGTRENIKVFVSEEAYSSAESLKEGLAQSLGELKNISVECDPSVSAQGCRIETEFGEIDARIQVQLDNIAHSMGASSS